MRHTREMFVNVFTIRNSGLLVALRHNRQKETLKSRLRALRVTAGNSEAGEESFDIVEAGNGQGIVQLVHNERQQRDRDAMADAAWTAETAELGVLQHGQLACLRLSIGC